jgi:hypothetical protein
MHWLGSPPPGRKKGFCRENPRKSWVLLIEPLNEKAAEFIRRFQNVV